jgi:hypothetical protein
MAAGLFFVFGRVRFSASLQTFKSALGRMNSVWQCRTESSFDSQDHRSSIRPCGSMPRPAHALVAALPTVRAASGIRWNICSGRGPANVKPEDRESQLRIRRFDKCEYDASATTHRLRSTVDDIAERAAAIVEFHKGDNIGFSVLPFGLDGPAYDRKGFDGTCAATFLPFDGSPANRATLRGWPAEMMTSHAEWQQQPALTRCFPVRSRFATDSWRGIFHFALAAEHHASRKGHPCRGSMG